MRALLVAHAARLPWFQISGRFGGFSGLNWPPEIADYSLPMAPRAILSK
jgi:hypothetical protein